MPPIVQVPQLGTSPTHRVLLVGYTRTEQVHFRPPAGQVLIRLQLQALLDQGPLRTLQREVQVSLVHRGIIQVHLQTLVL